MKLLMTVLRGEFNIPGFRNKDIRRHLPYFSSGKVSRPLTQLSYHGLIKKVANTYMYYVRKLAKETILLGEKIKELAIIPALNY